MILSLLRFLCNQGNLTLKLHHKEYLNEGWLFIGRFKVGILPRMINKEVLAQLTEQYIKQIGWVKAKILFDQLLIY